MSVTITVTLNGVPVPLVLDTDDLATIAASIPTTAPPSSPYMTVTEAAEFLRCKRQHVDDLLSQRRLPRVKDGSRTLIPREAIEAHLCERGDDDSCSSLGE